MSYCGLDGKKVDVLCDDVAYKVMFTNGNLAKLFFDYLNKDKPVKDSLE